MPDLTLSEGLNAPMVPVAGTELLPWEATQYRLRYECGPVTAHGLVTNVSPTHGPQQWHVYCIGPDGVGMDAYAGSADQAKAQVEEHIAAHIETLLRKAAVR
jgi:hypothetical protein